MPAPDSSRDAVILGGGLGGLVCAAYLAKNGARPLLLETQHRIGGRCGSNPHRGYAVDRIPFVSHKTLLEAMDELGIKFRWYKLPPNPAYIQPADRIGAFPGLNNPEELARTLEQPVEAVLKYKSIIDELGRVDRSDIAKLKKTRLVDWITPQRWREIEPVIVADFQFRPWAITPQQVPELSVGELVNVLTAGGPTESAVPQPKLYPADDRVGGMQAIPEAFGRVIRQHGGTIRTNCHVLEAGIEKGRITRVSFLNEDRLIEEIAADLVISDIPVWNAMGTVLDAGQFPREMVHNARLLGEWETEGITIGFALRELPTRRSDGKKEDLCRWCRLLLGKKGQLIYAGAYIVSSLACPASAPEGKHLLIVGRAVPRGTTRDLGLMRNMATESINVLRRIYSDFDEVCDWWRLLPLPKAPPIHCLSTIVRPGIKTPVNGLYFTGDTVETGEGRPYSLDLAVYTGRQAAKLIIGE